jgi:hypothetical protein
MQKCFHRIATRGEKTYCINNNIRQLISQSFVQLQYRNSMSKLEGEVVPR